MYHGVSHSLGAVGIFVAVLLLFSALRRSLGSFFRADAFCASACAIFFFFGRELRDLEKLGHLDVEGLFIPVAVVAALALVLACYRPDGNSGVKNEVVRNTAVDFKLRDTFI